MHSRADYKIWGIECAGDRVGVCGIKNIDYVEKRGEYWGYIGEKAFWGKGVGSLMMRAMFSEAIQLGLSTLYLKVSANNQRAISLYLRKGFSDFEVEGSEDGVVSMQKRLDE